VIEPELDKAKEEVGDLAKDMDDLVLYALYPVTGKKFLKWKYGHEQPPKEVMPRTLEDVKKEDELVKKAKSGQLLEKPSNEPPEKSESLRTFNVFIDGEYYQVGVDEPEGSPVIRQIQQMGGIPAQMPAMPAAPAAAPAATKPGPAPAEEKKEAAPAAAPAAAAAEGTPLLAPMPGMIVSYAKKVGDSVSEGETVLVLEAMKMENALPAPTSGTLKAINFSSGDSVKKGDVLAVIG
jgi:oxaloacetate decarboxylase alpha subunit/pyruvate carboxylase subunit B